MAATCEIHIGGGPCGVIALGRCARCGKGFCSSHRALAPGGVPITNVCTACHQVENAAIRDRRRAERAAEQFVTKGAIELLEAAGLPSASLHRLQRTYERAGLLGRKERQVERYQPFADAWVIGPANWSYNDDDSYRGVYCENKPFLTALAKNDGAADGPRIWTTSKPEDVDYPVGELVRVRQLDSRTLFYAGPGSFQGLHDETGKFRGKYPAVEALIRTMAGRAPAGA